MDDITRVKVEEASSNIGKLVTGVSMGKAQWEGYLQAQADLHQRCPERNPADDRRTSKLK